MEAVLSWVKQIFILSILSTVVTHLMPSAKYTKYASYICGLLIVMVCIQPLAAVFHGGISPDKIYESVMTYNQSNRLKQELTYREGDSAQSVMEAYEKETAKTVEEYVLENGYYPAKTTVTVEKDKDSKDYGKICAVSVVLSEKKEQQISVEQIVIGERRRKRKNNLNSKDMEDNLILEGLLSMVTELKEKLEAQVTPASREETLERLEAIEQALSELHSNLTVPEEKLQVIQSQLDDIKSRMQGQQKNIEDTKKITLETYRYFKVMIDTLGSCKTDKEDVTPLPFYQRIYNKITSWIRPGLFVFWAVLVICSASIFLNVRLVTRMQQLQDNDIKYRYLLMQGWADGEIFDILETKFNWQRDNGFIQSLTDSVIDFEYRSRKQAEALERARLLNEQAEQLRKEADKLGKP